jgi:hypothetical protein
VRYKSEQMHGLIGDKNKTMDSSQNPQSYVNENVEELTRIIKHSSNSFCRALAMAALVEYGDDPTTEEVVNEMERLKKSREEDQ